MQWNITEIFYCRGGLTDQQNSTIDPRCTDEPVRILSQPLELGKAEMGLIVENAPGKSTHFSVMWTVSAPFPGYVTGGEMFTSICTTLGPNPSPFYMCGFDPLDSSKALPIVLSPDPLHFDTRIAHKKVWQIGRGFSNTWDSNSSSNILSEYWNSNPSNWTAAIFCNDSFVPAMSSAYGGKIVLTNQEQDSEYACAYENSSSLSFQMMPTSQAGLYDNISSFKFALSMMCEGREVGTPDFSATVYLHQGGHVIGSVPIVCRYEKPRACSCGTQFFESKVVVKRGHIRIAPPSSNRGWHCTTTSTTPPFGITCSCVC